MNILISQYNHLRNWILNNKKNFDIKLKIVTSLQSFFQKIYDFELSMSLDGNQYIGRGIDANLCLAFNKAFVEMIERYVMEASGNKTTNGIAGHFSLKAASQNAKFELIERDNFFCHHLTKTPFHPLNLDHHIIYGTKLYDLQQKLKNNNVELKLFQLSSLNNCHTIMSAASCISTNKRFGVILGLGTNTHFDVAVNKAVVGSLPNILYILKRKMPPLPQASFNSRRKLWTGLDHFRLGLHKASYQNFSFINKSQHSRPESVYLNNKINKKIYIEDLTHISKKTFPDLNLFFCKAFSDELQNMFYGKISSNKVNFKRLEDFSNNEIYFQDLNHYPHFFG